MALTSGHKPLSPATGEAHLRLIQARFGELLLEQSVDAHKPMPWGAAATADSSSGSPIFPRLEKYFLRAMLSYDIGSGFLTGLGGSKQRLDP